MDVDGNINEAGDQENVAQEKVSRKRRNPFIQQNLKEEKEKRRQKRARIIIRNISYKCKEDSLREYFEKFGKINDLNLLKRPDGKLVGCAFVQFETVNQAAKAIFKTNSQEFLGRPIFVDWALGKNEYEKRNNSNALSSKESSEIKKEQDAAMETVKKESKNSEVENADESTVKSENEDAGEDENDTDDENGGDEDITDEDDVNEDGGEIGDEDEMDGEEEMDDEDDVDEGENESELDDSDEENKDKKKIKLSVKPEKKRSNDLSEGCTIFIKNVPFEATNDDLRKVCRKYGPVYYALINTDPVSGHSKGTGFVKFKQKESADMCLAGGESFNLMNSVLEPFEALSRNDLQNIQTDKKGKNKVSDSRNLYLAKEGLIMTGSPAAEGVSATDLSKRHKLEQVKTQILKNLNRFVSRNRLSIHNLPMTFDDEKLKAMIIKFTKLKPHECRVMLENRPSVGFPKGKPKGFGFVSFETHQDALLALRKLNNNPNVFGNTNRPIVGFSIEDRSVHNVKEKRLKKSRDMNPTFKLKVEKRKEKRKLKRGQKLSKPANQADDKTIVQKNLKKTKKTPKPEPKAVDANEEENFVGMAAKHGTFLRMRSNKKIIEQATDHNKKLSDIKRKNKKRKERLMLRLEKKQIDRPKQGKKNLEKSDNFSHLVDKYKKLIDKTSSPIKKSKRTKWYTE